jgi:hypothetical protein
MRCSRHGNLAAVAALAGLLGGAGHSAGQDEPGQAPPAPAPPPEKLTLSLATGFQYIFETDIDGGGEIAITRVPLVIGAEAKISDELDLQANLRYELGLYDFKGISSLGANPWDDIHTLSVDARVVWALNQKTRLWGGPVVLWSRETGADWSDSMVGGAFFGATYIFNRKLIVGGGLGIVSQIEDDILVYPIIVLNWRIGDKTTLSSRAGPAGIAATGAELVRDLGEGWEVGVGARYEFRRFRLDNTGIAPNGVGEETNFPAWVRLSYRFNENFNVDLFCGLALSGRLDLDDTGGNPLARADYDAAPTVALIGTLRF